MNNRTIFENYYIDDRKMLWEKFEGQILINNRKIKILLENNLDLIQHHSTKEYSNLECVYLFIAHIDEFESTRIDEEKTRHILFPDEINSIFGVSPVKDTILPSTESLEAFICEMQRQNRFEEVVLGIDEPYIKLNEDGNNKILLNDTPRLRQLYFDNHCFRGAKVRLESLNFALKYINSRNITFKYKDYSNLRNIIVKGINIIFIYEYCLNTMKLRELAPEEKSVIVNLHNWNGVCCIAKEAYEFASQIDVKLLTMEEFYGYINKFRSN